MENPYASMYEVIGKTLPVRERRTKRVEIRRGFLGLKKKVYIEELTVLPDISPDVFWDGARNSQANLRGNDVEHVGNETVSKGSLIGFSLFAKHSHLTPEIIKKTIKG